MSETRVGQCRVCASLDDDRSDKECSYLSSSDAWVCASDRVNAARLNQVGLDSGLRPCDVCVLLDGDESLKECTYCALCRAWLCQADEPNMKRRVLAAKAKMMRSIGVRRPCNCQKTSERSNG